MVVLVVCVVIFIYLFGIPILKSLRIIRNIEPTNIRFGATLFANDEEIEKITKEARRNALQFYERLRNPQVGDSGFAVAITLPFSIESNNGIETIWLKDIQLEGDSGKGRIIDQPRYLDSVNSGDIFQFNPLEITDWRYLNNGELVGGELLKAVFRRMTPRQRYNQMKELNFEIPEFKSSSLLENGNDQNSWRSIRWNFEVVFPNDWEQPCLDSENNITKSSIEVYCKSTYGASVAIYANQSSQFNNSIENLEQELKPTLWKGNLNELNFIDCNSNAEIPYHNKSFYYEIENWRYKYLFIMNENVILTISFHIPHDMLDRGEKDFRTIGESITF